MASQPRYIVEPGTDGSFLLVDRGAQRNHRVATERMDDEQEVRLHVETLGGLDAVTSQRTGSLEASFGPGIEQLLADDTVTIDQHHNFNHLPPE